MKSQLLYFLRILFILLFALTACDEKDDDNPLDPNGGNGGFDNNSGQPLAGLDGIDDVKGVMATIQYSFGSMIGVPATDIAMAFATFGNQVDAGTVAINGTNLGKVKDGEDVYYVIPDPNNPLTFLTGVRFDGQAHNWSVSGGNGIPAFTASVNSPSDFSITAPVEGANISVSGGLTITWNNTASSADVVVMVVPTEGSAKDVEFASLDDDGSHTISTSQLGDISGEAIVYVIKYKYNVKAVGDDNFVALAEIVKMVIVTFE